MEQCVGTAKQLRVCWQGDTPRPGELLVSASGRVAYVVNGIRVLHRRPQSAKPNLLLDVLRFPAAQAPAAAVVHAWTRTACQQPERRVYPPPKPVPPIAPVPTVYALAGAARAKRLAAEAAPPPQSDPSEWPDVEDTVQTRRPKQIRGHRRGEVLWRMARRGDDVSRDHLMAATLFRVGWDVAAFGYSSADALAEKVSGSDAGPSSGPTRNASERIDAEREVRNALAAVGTAAVPLLLWVLVKNRDVAAWCVSHDRLRADGRHMDPRKTLGRLLATLDRLVEFYGVSTKRAHGTIAQRAG